MLLLSPFTKYVTFGSPNIFSTNFDFSIIFLDNFLWTKYKLKMVWLCHMHFLNLSCIMDRKLLGVYLRFRDRVLNNLLFRRSERSSRRHSWVMFGSTQYHIRGRKNIAHPYSCRLWKNSCSVSTREPQPQIIFTYWEGKLSHWWYKKRPVAWDKLM